MGDVNNAECLLLLLFITETLAWLLRTCVDLGRRLRSLDLRSLTGRKDITVSPWMFLQIKQDSECEMPDTGSMWTERDLHVH